MFIKNPLSGFIFYFLCISVFLIVPPEGFGAISFYFLLPFILFAILGLNLSFFSTLFGKFTMSKLKKQNHAIEHGTIYFLYKRYGNKIRVGGLAKKEGFRIYGFSKKHAVSEAFNQFIKEFNKENPSLILSLRCGSNIVTSQGFGLILLTLSAILLKISQPSNMTILLVLVANAILYFLLRNSLGSWVQEKFFMSLDFEKARIHSINKVKKHYWEHNPVYFVRTLID